MKIFAALPLILLSASPYALLAASGNFTLPLTEIKITGAYLKGAADTSRARAAFLKSRAPGDPTTAPVPVTGQHVMAIVGVGDPMVYHRLLFDTGSSLTWCKDYLVSSTTKPTGQEIYIVYASSQHFWGVEYLDRVALTLDLVIEDQPVGGALSVSSLEYADGVLGLGPVELTQGQLYPDTSATAPTVMDNLKTQGKIQDKMFGVFLPPPIGSDGKGSVTFGGVDSSLYEGELTYVPVTSAYPASTHWGIDISSCTYGNDYAIFQTPIAGIVDTGVPMILLADDHLQAYMNAIPGAYFDHTGLMVVSQEAFLRMKPLHFTIGGRVFTLDVNAQLIPQEQNGELGGDPTRHYSCIVPIGHMSNSGQGFDFVLGLAFLRRYYSVYDATNSNRRRIGFARTKYTFTDEQSLSG